MEKIKMDAKEINRSTKTIKQLNEAIEKNEKQMLHQMIFTSLVLTAFSVYLIFFL